MRRHPLVEVSGYINCRARYQMPPHQLLDHFRVDSPIHGTRQRFHLHLPPALDDSSLPQNPEHVGEKIRLASQVCHGQSLPESLSESPGNLHDVQW